MKLKANSLKDLFLHLGLIVGIGFVIILTFFYIYLPVTTHHGESITVPKLEGVHLDELDEFLLERDLRFEVTADSGFSTEYPPLTVLSQNPKEGKKVKENRKIYVSLNATSPPNVKMPKLVDGSLKNAQMVLESYGLLLGKITYEPHEFQNAVLKQKVDGEEIAAGADIPKGSTIDLVIGNGNGRPFSMPELVGNNKEDAEFIIIGSGLQLGKVRTREDDEKAGGIVLQQYPESGTSVRTGNTVDIWVVAPKNKDEILTPDEI
ncbi:PASTA domain-containing protein [Marivirga harenae]|uniref:PASTA domain-containing protein n=1 Tax=Marivirga harenae TaxID=2010992 RepID=UPI0026DF4D3C|nr:PASTA domain-containing protein [Marivirga harenae]WKV11038.1 PASTA domain-containing protein [Marivirga harenae]|tara:strand:- start:126021 stop:126809 length:789 start_codon:yes stop_codon:yes gene_type:complete